MEIWQSQQVKKISGSVQVAGDKSISHRSIMFGALANGTTKIKGFLQGEDCLATMRAFIQMGVEISDYGNGEISVKGVGLRGLTASNSPLNLGNSGTSIRLMAGILVGQYFDSVLIGDQSLTSRPMKRIADPLIQMGAKITLTNQNTAPINIKGLTDGQKLKSIDFVMPVVSAQLKSCLLLAGLYADGVTTIYQKGISRDHSEKMLQEFGATINFGEDEKGRYLSILGDQSLTACEINVPADISSAAFFIAAGLLAEDGVLHLKNVGVNPTRSAIITLFQQMGGKIILKNKRTTAGELVADLEVYPSLLEGIDVDPELVPIAIDEFPIFFIAASCAKGITRVDQLSELRVKESDRLLAMEKGLKANGVDCQVNGDSILINGKQNQSFTGGEVNSLGDHRIAMSFAVAGIRAIKPITILDCQNVVTSFPNFLSICKEIGMKVNKLS